MTCEAAETSKRVLKERVEIILDDLDQSWYPSEINRAAILYNNGASLVEMAKKLRPKDKIADAVDEVVLLIMHLGRQGMI